MMLDAPLVKEDQLFRPGKKSNARLERAVNFVQ